jgi:hypothetical protein
VTTNAVNDSSVSFSATRADRKRYWLKIGEETIAAAFVLRNPATRCSGCEALPFRPSLRYLRREVKVIKTIRSRSDKSVNDILEDKWKIVAKRIIAAPTPRTRFEAPRLGIYEYDVEPRTAVDRVAETSANGSKQTPLITFRKIGS